MVLAFFFFPLHTISETHALPRFRSFTVIHEQVDYRFPMLFMDAWVAGVTDKAAGSKPSYTDFLTCTHSFLGSIPRGGISGPEGC